jgi:hypothetical protein
LKHFYIFLVAAVAAACAREPDKVQVSSLPSASAIEKDQPVKPPQEFMRPSARSDAERQASFDVHRRAQKEWFDGARLVVELTHDPEAEAVLKFLLQNVFLLEPVGSNHEAVMIDDQEGRPHPIGMLMVTEEDLQRFPLYKQQVSERGAAGLFNGENRLLTVIGARMTMRSRGLVLLHEGAHAKQFMTKTYGLNPAALSFEEVRVHTFQNRLTALMGGEAYAKLLSTEVAAVAEDSRKMSTRPDEPAIAGLKRLYNLVFDQIFGPAQSELERDLRQTSLKYHAVFTYIDQKFAGRDPAFVLDLKARFYRQRDHAGSGREYKPGL